MYVYTLFFTSRGIECVGVIGVCIYQSMYSYICTPMAPIHSNPHKSYIHIFLIEAAPNRFWHTNRYIYVSAYICECTLIYV